MAKSKQKKKRIKLISIFIAELLILVLILIGFKVYTSMNKLNRVDQDDHLIQKNDDVEQQEGFRNIVLFGVDSRENYLKDSTRSDTIIIASINNKTKGVKLASVYRDTYVNIPDIGYKKVNAAYFNGGYSLALTTINKNFDLDAREYVTVNFQAVVNVVDLLGGITLDIEENELKYLNGYIKSLNKINGTNSEKITSAGTQEVNGTQATAYARIRYTAGGDFKRAERQRIVVQKIFDKAKSSSIGTINNIIDEMFPQVATNLSNTELLSLAKDIFSYDIVGQEGFPFEKDAHKYQKVSLVFPINLAANVTKLHEFLYDVKDYVPSATVQEYSDYIESIRVQ
jgi:LCP family protein required for cell wall assembly